MTFLCFYSSVNALVIYLDKDNIKRMKRWPWPIFQGHMTLSFFSSQSCVRALVVPIGKRFHPKMTSKNDLFFGLLIFNSTHIWLSRITLIRQTSIFRYDPKDWDILLPWPIFHGLLTLFCINSNLQPWFCLTLVFTLHQSADQIFLTNIALEDYLDLVRGWKAEISCSLSYSLFYSFILSFIIFCWAIYFLQWCDNNIAFKF